MHMVYTYVYKHTYTLKKDKPSYKFITEIKRATWAKCVGKQILPKGRIFFLGGEQLFLRGCLYRHFRCCLWIYSNSHRIQINCIAKLPPHTYHWFLSMFCPPPSLPSALLQTFYSRPWEPCTDRMLMTQLGQDHGNVYFISTPALWKECRPQTTVQVALTQSACQRAGVSLHRRVLA